MFYIGTSGWSYSDWEGKFYPSEVRSKERLYYYSRKFCTVEVNNSFYQLPSWKTFLNWYKQVPEKFIFSVKASRYITHMKNLKGAGKAMERLMKNASGLEDKLGPVLFQLPPRWRKNRERLANFISGLEKNRLYAFEFRDKSWYEEDIFSLLWENNCAMVIHDHKDGQAPVKATAKWIYVRLHGPGGGYLNPYSREELYLWKEKLLGLNFKKGFIYFNNDTNGYAVENAKELEDILKI